MLACRTAPPTLALENLKPPLIGDHPAAGRLKACSLSVPPLAITSSVALLVVGSPATVFVLPFFRASPRTVRPLAPPAGFLIWNFLPRTVCGDMVAAASAAGARSNARAASRLGRCRMGKASTCCGSHLPTLRVGSLLTE